MAKTGSGLPWVDFNNRLNVVGNWFTPILLKVIYHLGVNRPPSSPPIPADTTVPPFAQALRRSHSDPSSLGPSNSWPSSCLSLRYLPPFHHGYCPMHLHIANVCLSCLPQTFIKHLRVPGTVLGLRQGSKQENAYSLCSRKVQSGGTGEASTNQGLYAGEREDENVGINEWRTNCSNCRDACSDPSCHRVACVPIPEHYLARVAA